MPRNLLVFWSGVYQLKSNHFLSHLDNTTHCGWVSWKQSNRTNYFRCVRTKQWMCCPLLSFTTSKVVKCDSANRKLLQNEKCNDLWLHKGMWWCCDSRCVNQLVFFFFFFENTIIFRTFKFPINQERVYFQKLIENVMCKCWVPVSKKREC